jgi:hypothetical protein
MTAIMEVTINRIESPTGSATHTLRHVFEVDKALLPRCYFIYAMMYDQFTDSRFADKESSYLTAPARKAVSVLLNIDEKLVDYGIFFQYIDKQKIPKMDDPSSIRLEDFVDCVMVELKLSGSEAELQQALKNMKNAKLFEHGVASVFMEGGAFATYYGLMPRSGVYAPAAKMWFNTLDAHGIAFNGLDNVLCKLQPEKDKQD